MFLDEESVTFATYDVIIIGSGPAGITLSKQLKTNNKKSIIVETGKLDVDDDIQKQYSAMHGRGHIGGDHWSRHWVRALGGTSAVWSGWCAPLSNRNFEFWPIGRSELDPFYLLAAKILHLSVDLLTFSRTRNCWGYLNV